MDTNHKIILVKKASGENELFSTIKLERSLLNAGAGHESIARIIDNIDNWITPGISTKQIYNRAFSILSADKSASSFRYRLKQAILELGPTGYPFEILIGEIFKKQGFDTEVGITVEGKCVTHEMDVIASSGKTQHLVECKFHKDHKQVSVQVPLYVRSRVDDIVAVRKKLARYNGFKFTAWVVTNTRFSDDSIQYGTGSGIQLLAWDYPRDKGLKDIIEQLKLYPITILSKLSLKEKQALLNQGIITCTQLHENIEALTGLELSHRKIKNIIRELKAVCNLSPLSNLKL